MEGFGFDPASARQSDWLSVHITTTSPDWHYVAVYSTARHIAVTSSSYEHVCAFPRLLMVRRTLSSAGSPSVTTAAAPPSKIHSLAEPSV